MANGLRSLKYGIGNQDVGTKGSAQDMLMFLAESIGPGYGLGEYSEGIQDLLEGNISGIPKAGLGLVAALPFGRSISKGAQKVVDKGVDIFHGTSAKNLKKIEEKGLFDPTGRQSPASEIGIHVATDPKTSNVIVKDSEDAITYLGSLNPNVKSLRIPDINRFSDPRNWKKEIDNLKLPTKLKNDFNEIYNDAIKYERKNEILGSDEYFFNTKAGKVYWLTKLREWGKNNNFNSFVYKNKHEGPIDKDSLMLLYPQQIKDKFTKVKDWSDPNPMKAEGGSIKDYYKTYNTQRFI